MSPAILPNSYLVFHHLIYRRFLKIGLIIKVLHPDYGLIVKKIIRIDSTGDYWLEGLNSQSVSSIQMGAIELQMIRGIVLYYIKSPHNNQSTDIK